MAEPGYVPVKEGGDEIRKLAESITLCAAQLWEFDPDGYARWVDATEIRIRRLVEVEGGV